MRILGNAMALGTTLTVLATCTSTQLTVTARPQSAGQTLYEDRCGRCHDAFPAHAYQRSEWPAIVRRMGGEAHLTDLEARRVLLWLQEGR